MISILIIVAEKETGSKVPPSTSRKKNRVAANKTTSKQKQSKQNKQTKQATAHGMMKHAAFPTTALAFVLLSRDTLFFAVALCVCVLFLIFFLRF
jgi:hypothetical protein